MAQTFNSKLKSVAVHYARLLRVRVTATTLKKEMEEHPYYPSLLSLADTFTRHGILNEAYEIEGSALDQLKTPFVAFSHVEGIGNDFVLVTGLSADTVSITKGRQQAETVPKEVFLRKYQRVAWVATPETGAGEPDFEKKRMAEKTAGLKKFALYAAAIVAILLLIAINVPEKMVPGYVSIVVLQLAGLATTLLLLLYDLNKQNSLLQNICGVGNQTDCEAVLSSKASRIAGFSWGEIGFVYFAATTIGLLFPGLPFAEKAFWLAAGSTLASSYIPFSIYYQWRVVRRWCPLCLIMQLVLALELIWAVLFYWQKSGLNGLQHLTVLPILFCLILPVIILAGIKPVLYRARDHDHYRAAFRRLQYNPDIFHSLLGIQPKAPDNWQRLGITIGNPLAQVTIIKVCNPYCNPCAQAHPILEELIAHNSNVRLKIIFTARNDKADRGAVVVKHLLSVAAQGNTVLTLQALDDWYLTPSKDYAALAKRYPVDPDKFQTGLQLDAMRKWCEEAEITHTPTIFVNGHRLPENYDIEELKYIL